LRHITTELLFLTDWIVILFQCDQSGNGVDYSFAVDYGFVVDCAALNFIMDFPHAPSFESYLP
jgi:hypothetical protein